MGVAEIIYEPQGIMGLGLRVGPVGLKIRASCTERQRPSRVTKRLFLMSNCTFQGVWGICGYKGFGFWGFALRVSGFRGLEAEPE